MQAPRETWSGSGIPPQRVAIEARAVRGGACTLLLLRDSQGVRLLFHGAESTGVQLAPDVHRDLLAALQQIVG